MRFTKLFQKIVKLKKSYVYIATASVLNRLPLENNFLLEITLYRASMIRIQFAKFQNVNSPHISHFGTHFWKSFIIMTLKLLSHWKQLFFFEQETWICKLLCFKSALKFRKQLRLWFDIVCCNNHWNIDDTINLLSSFLNV